MNIFKRGEERQRFSIKKYHFGAASVLIGAIIFASGTQEASANEFKGDLSSTVVGESTSSSEQTEITNNPITIPEAESPTIEVSNPTDKKKDTSKSESSTTEVSNPTDNKEDTLKSESSTTEVSNPTDNKEDTSKSESHTTEVSNPTDNKKDTSKEVREKTDDLSHKSLTLSKNNQKQERNHTPKRRSKRSIVNKEQPPVDGYDVNLEFSPKDDGLSYKINKVTDPKHYTFEVISKGEDGSKQYTISVRKEDLNQEGTLDRFFITTFDNGIRISRREIDKARIRGGEQIKIDDLTLLSVTKKGDEYAFRFQKITDSVGDNYKPVYGPNIEKITSPVVSYPLILPVWKAQTTHYYDEDGNEIAPSYTQYGWTKSKYTTEPPEIKGYDLDYTKIPFNKNGIINKSNAKFEGNIRYGTSTVSRGTIFRKDTVLDNQSTIKTEVWFTYAKRPNTFDPVDGTIRDRGRVASNNLPDANYDFMKNTEGYEIRERLGTAEEEKKYERLGMNGQVVFQKFRFQKNGLPSKDAVSEAEYDGGDATSSTSVVLKKGEVSNSRYDIGRTFDFSNVFEYPDTVEYYYITHKGKVVVHYVDEAGNTIKGTVEDTPNVKVDTAYDTTDHKLKVIEKDGKRYIFTKVKDGDKETGQVVEGTTSVTYIYKELGKYIPYIPENPGDGYEPNKPGTDAPPVPYDETPEEPGNNPPLPYIPGHTPEDPKGNPLKPVDPEDPTKGYVPPSITNPNNPSEDTPIPYKKNPEVVKEGKVVVHYVDEAGNTIKGTVEDTPNVKVDTAYDTTDHKLKVIEKDGKRYIFTKVKDGDKETGQVVEGTTSVTYIYKELGKYIPYIPENPGDGYEPNKPGTDAPPVPYDETPEEPGNNPPLPYIPGHTPEDPKGNPLKPVDPEDPTKGYVPPSITNPNNPSEDTPIPYKKNPEVVKEGKVVVHYVDEAGNTIKGTVEDTPNVKVDTAYDTTDHKLKVIEKDGKRYIFTKVKDGDKETGQVVEGTTSVTYIYKELGKYIPYIPENPGDGYEPNKPGTDAPPVPYDETPEEPGNNPPLPYIPGHTPEDPKGNPLKPVDPEDPTKGYVPPSITNPNNPSEDTPIPYKKNPEVVKEGKVVVHYVDEAGNTIKGTVEDTPNTKVDTAYDTTDHKLKVIEKDGKRYIFTKVKDGDKETGQVVEGTTSITYIYKELGKYIPYIPENPGDGYEPNKPGTDAPPVPYDETPEEPGNNPPLPYIPGHTPEDPKGNPLKPVDPEDPTKGYVPPSITNPNNPSEDTPIPYKKNPEVVKEGKVVVHYVDEAGNTIKGTVEDTPNVKVDTAYDTTDHKLKVIEKDGKRYIFTKVKDGDKETGQVAEGTTSVTYIYKELGKYIPYIPENPGDGYEPNKPGTDAPPVPYDETPEEPGNNPPLPYIPGHTPEDPKGNPLKPVDPEDPTKGYVPPSITNPNDPSEDTPIPYKKNPEVVKEGKVVVHYVDEAGNTIKGTVEDTPNVKVDTAYDTTDHKLKVIEKDGKRYIFTKVKDGDKETGQVAEGTTSVTYIYKELGKYIPYIPENPGDGYEPNKPGTDAPPVPYDETPEEPGNNPPLPYIPGHTPEDPKGNPLKPVDPEDPTKGYVPPSITNPNDPSEDTPIPYKKNPEVVKEGKVVVHYVDEAGNTIKGTVEDTPNVKVDTAYDTTDHKLKVIEKDGKRYIFTKVKDGDKETGQVVEGTTSVTYIYKELGKYIPYIPENPGDGYEPNKPGTDAPPVPYDETPEEPGNNPPLPYIPGHTPEDPKGNPLKPVDPEDPTKGYVPPSITNPNNPSEDTPIPYKKNPEVVKEGKVVVHYVDEAGNTIKGTVEDTPNVKVDTAYDTTDHKLKVIEKDGKRYIFTKVKDGDKETGQVVEGTTSITYIYKELGKYIPYIPENPGDGYEPNKPGTDAPPVPYDETPEEPGNNPPLPYIPGHTPEDPKGNPLKPVDPEDPTKGYVPPSITNPNNPSEDTPIPYKKNPEVVKEGKVVVHYVDEAGNTIKGTVEDTPNVKVDTAYDTTDHKLKVIEKDGKRYIFTKVKDGDKETGQVAEGTTSVTYIYKELGKYIPYIPENPGDGYEPNKPGTDAPPVPYDETPEEPGNNPPLPYIPGHTPEDPKGNPLKPVDPEDPTKGYVPPSITNPNNPSEDTPNKPDIPSKLKTPDMQEKKDKSKTQVKEKRVQQLPDTGETNNTGLLSAMLGLLGGIIFSTSRKKYQKEDQQ